MDFEQNIVAIVLFGNLALLLNGFILACAKVMIEKVVEWCTKRYSVWILLRDLVIGCIYFIVIFGLQWFVLANWLSSFIN